MTTSAMFSFIMRAMQQLTITRPDDWHLHFRDGDKLSLTVPDTARVFGHALAMPNLVPPVLTVEQALGYHERILAQATPAQKNWFKPMMALYLTDNTSVAEVEKAAKTVHIIGCKLYPAGATTNSDSGVTSITKLYPLFEAMQRVDLPLLVHGEVTDSHIDIFDREKVFIDTTLAPLAKQFPKLRVVFEHITTADAVAFVEASNKCIAATITAHHLLFNRNQMLAGGIRPHYYCLPILKRSTHQQALIKAATSGNAKFFLGTDSAPHATHKKETACGCAGSYTSPLAIELYATAFEQANALDKLEAFASFHGADFYRLPRNSDTIMLVKQDWQLPAVIAFGNEQITPLCAGETLHWQLRAP
jgi:dihydroorotase